MIKEYKAVTYYLENFIVNTDGRGRVDLVKLERDLDNILEISRSNDNVVAQLINENQRLKAAVEAKVQQRMKRSITDAAALLDKMGE